MRGKGAVRSRAVPVCGITPACAGKSKPHIAAKRGFRDHPRVCGEKDPPYGGGAGSQGSPPRVRGKVTSELPVIGGQRITPACAGKSRGRLQSRLSCGDHPRVCGEKSFASSIGCFCLGSPPRVRGKEHDLIDNDLKLGITPACAGKRQPANRVWFEPRDHPRVCGEKYRRLSLQYFQLGSPPRVRGKVVSGDALYVRPRITPACAGKSLHQYRRKGRRRGHPRVCGEKDDTNLILAIKVGSPPRVRGKACKTSSRHLMDRITPACAGKSFIFICLHIVN